MISGFGWRKYRFTDSSDILSQTLAQEFEKYTDEVFPYLENNLVIKYPLEGILGTENKPDIPMPNDLNRHLMPQTSFIYHKQKMKLDLLINFHFVGKIHEILEKFPEVKGIHSMPHKMKSINTQEVKKHLSQKYLHKIKEIYSDDFKLYESFCGKSHREVKDIN